MEVWIKCEVLTHFQGLSVKPRTYSVLEDNRIVVINENHEQNIFIICLQFS